MTLQLVFMKIRDTVRMAVIAMALAMAWVGIKIGTKNIGKLVVFLLEEKNKIKTMLDI